MTFTEITAHEFDKFAFDAKGHNFLQSSAFASVRAKRGAAPKLFAVKDGARIVLAGLCGAYGTSLDCLYGPVGDATPESIRAWTAGLSACAKPAARASGHKPKIYLSISPFFPVAESKPWQALGWRALKRGLGGRLRYIAARPLPASYDQLLNSLDRKMRYEIRRAAKNGLKLRDLSYDELPILEQLLQASADRKDFQINDLAYLQMFHRAYEGNPDYQVRFVVVEHDQEPIAGGVFVFSKLECVHFLGGNSAKSLELGGMYYLLNAMMQASIGQGIPRFNFFGVNGLGGSDSGLVFKRKWGAEVTEMFGVWVFPVDKLKFMAWQIKQLVIK
ncbi:aminoacyltransferase [Candidatus Saccharibacteria bacterium]|nr:aminoacyltransferase [Candidatus Saccharibacteria bacterium]